MRACVCACVSKPVCLQHEETDDVSTAHPPPPPVTKQDWEAALKLLDAAERDPAVAAAKDSRLYTAAMRVCGAAGKRDKVCMWR